MRWRTLVVATCIGLGTGFLLALATWGGLLGKTELFLLDVRFVARATLRPTAVPVHPDIRLVTLDDESYRAAGEHAVFWLGRYARLCQALIEAGATVVGLDIIPTYAGREADFRAFALMALRARGKLVLITYLGSDEDHDEMKLSLPAPEILPALGVENLALANLTRDVDGIERAQAIYPVPHTDLQRETWPFLAALLAERHTGQRLDGESRTFGGRAVPALGPGDARLLINYAGQPGMAFPAVPMQRVMERAEAQDRDFLARTYRGKVVLVGTVARGDQDFVETPFSLVRQSVKTAGLTGTTMSLHRSQPGIEVHAQVLNTLLTGAWLKKPPAWVQVGILLAVSVIAALVAALGGGAGAAWRVVLLALGWGVACWLAFDAGSLWIEAAGPLVGIPLAAGATWAWRYRFEETERLRVRGVFGRYVSPDVMEEMLLEPTGAVAPARRRITVLFSDINGFSTVCESESPEKVARMLSEHHAEMSAIIFRHRGTVIRFVGDQFMVLYGAPRPHPEPERAALRTALDMLARLDEMRRADPEGGRGGFHGVKIGIHTGDMLLATIGSAARSDYTAVGDAANVAARIQDLTKRAGTSVLVSEITRQGAGDMADVDFVDLGEWEVKGRQGMVRVLEPRPRMKTEGPAGPDLRQDVL